MKKNDRSYLKTEKKQDGFLDIPKDLQFGYKEYKYLVDQEGNEYRISEDHNPLFNMDADSDFDDGFNNDIKNVAPEEVNHRSLIRIEKEDECGNWKRYIPKEFLERTKALIEEHKKNDD